MKAFADWPELMAPEDVIECLGLAKNRVYDWFGLPDFPLVDGQKNCKRIGKFALRRWLNRGVSDAH